MQDNFWFFSKCQTRIITVKWMKIRTFENSTFENVWKLKVWKFEGLKTFGKVWKFNVRKFNEWRLEQHFISKFIKCDEKFKSDFSNLFYPIRIFVPIHSLFFQNLVCVQIKSQSSLFQILFIFSSNLNQKRKKMNFQINLLFVPPKPFIVKFQSRFQKF